jgi:hypothetical protein
MINQLLIGYFAFVRYLKKWEYNVAVHQLIKHFKKAYDLATREVSHSTDYEWHAYVLTQVN